MDERVKVYESKMIKSLESLGERVCFYPCRKGKSAYSG